MSDDDRGQRPTDPSHRTGPSHPTWPAIALLVGVTLLVVLLAVLSSL